MFCMNIVLSSLILLVDEIISYSNLISDRIIATKATEKSRRKLPLIVKGFWYVDSVESFITQHLK